MQHHLLVHLAMMLMLIYSDNGTLVLGCFDSLKNSSLTATLQTVHMLSTKVTKETASTSYYQRFWYNDCR